MAFLLGGPYYHMQGRAGNNVGRVVKGRNVFGMRPAKSNRPPSAAQLDVQMQLSLMAGWMSEMSGFIKIGFEDYDSEMSPWNAALKYNLANSITGVSPNYTIDYPKVLFSRGKLAQGKNVVMATTVDAQLDFTWSAAVPSLKVGAGTDKAIFVVYNPSKQEWDVSSGAATRSSLSYDMLLPVDWSGDNVQVWCSFLSTNNKEVSTTQFLGATVVQ
ncbi:MAG TPA: DUF6266 family protein [Pedobacter sp.]|uniref:DUF6266 family protein n=1 Tax=Pedobacter sp. TaxID=1411316 RepID=UPI002B68BC38|nr:DUF6266 family protein [Pedobacter sp.]HMI03126.1 DUF6266 family protein [Pedobacter sp.]